MAVRLGDEIWVTIYVGDEAVKTKFPAYDDPDMHTAINELIRDKVRGRGTRTRIEVIEPRIRFYNKVAQDVEGIQFKDTDGKIKSLSGKTEGWKSRVPDNWKSSTASYFEETEALSKEEAKN